ncbi:MAG: hypothetical protein ACK56I_27020, partial [bacterium]
VPLHQEERQLGAGEAEVVPLRIVVRGGVLVGRVLVGHEGVAQVDEEVGTIGEHVAQRVGVDAGGAVGVQVGVGLHHEAERHARGPRRAELPGVCRDRAIHAIAIGAVGGQASQLHHARDPRSQRLRDHPVLPPAGERD